MQGHRQHLPKILWAQPKPSAAAVSQLLGPFEIIGSSYQKSNGPKRNYWWQLPEIWWAHAKASAAPAEKIMGPTEAIGSSCHSITGPIQDYRRQLLEY
jgi:hypothetical protein